MSMNFAPVGGDTEAHCPQHTAVPSVLSPQARLLEPTLMSVNFSPAGGVKSPDPQHSGDPSLRSAQAACIPELME